MDIFEQQSIEATAESRPLAERMRPEVLADFVGHANVVGPDTLLYQAVQHDRIFFHGIMGPTGMR